MICWRKGRLPGGILGGIRSGPRRNGWIVGNGNLDIDGGLRGCRWLHDEHHRLSANVHSEVTKHRRQGIPGSCGDDNDRCAGIGFSNESDALVETGWRSESGCLLWRSLLWRALLFWRILLGRGWWRWIVGHGQLGLRQRTRDDPAVVWVCADGGRSADTRRLTRSHNAARRVSIRAQFAITMLLVYLVFVVMVLVVLFLGVSIVQHHLYTDDFFGGQFFCLDLFHDQGLQCRVREGIFVRNISISIGISIRIGIGIGISIFRSETSGAKISLAAVISIINDAVIAAAGYQLQGAEGQD